jgi:hypothetical protein
MQYVGMHLISDESWTHLRNAVALQCVQRHVQHLSSSFFAFLHKSLQQQQLDQSNTVAYIAGWRVVMGVHGWWWVALSKNSKKARGRAW